MSRVCPCTALAASASPAPSVTHHHNSMPHLSAEAKHHILLDYSPRSAAHSFAALAERHSIAGGANVVRHWHDRWDGTPQSLERRAGSGRQRTLSAAQVRRHVSAPIRNSNRAHRPVRYTRLLPQVQAATVTQVSLRTLQRYGLEEAGGRQTRGKKRTADECQCSYTCSVCGTSLSVACAHCAVCLCSCVTFSVC